MIGAIAGDIIGSVYEAHSIKTTEFPLFVAKSTFTDDSVLTLGIAKALLFRKKRRKKYTKNEIRQIYKENIRNLGIKYPNAGYGGTFYKWLFKKIDKPYNSYGNGSAMRVSPIGFAFNSVEKVLNEAKYSAEITHNHPEGIKGAQAVALSIFLARKGFKKKEIKNEIEKRFEYNLNKRVNNIRKSYGYDISCQGSVPEAIITFLESKNYEDSIRLAISIGGDSDTIACINGGIAQAYYKKIPKKIITKVLYHLDITLKKILIDFNKGFKVSQ